MRCGSAGTTAVPYDDVTVRVPSAFSVTTPRPSGRSCATVSDPGPAAPVVEVPTGELAPVDEDESDPEEQAATATDMSTTQAFHDLFNIVKRT